MGDCPIKLLEILLEVIGVEPAQPLIFGVTWQLIMSLFTRLVFT